MNDAIFNVVLAVIGLACACITSYIIPLIKSKYTAEQLNTINIWVKKAVECAEIIFNVPKSGKDKKEFVTNYLTNLINSKKEVISKEDLDILIEAAVQQLKMSSVTTGDANE